MTKFENVPKKGTYGLRGHAGLRVLNIFIYFHHSIVSIMK